MEAFQRVLKSHAGFLHIGIGQVGDIALSVMFWFLMARLIMPGDYGQINWLLSIATFASMCCVLGWGKTIVTYYPKEGRDELMRGAVTIVLVASLVVSIAMGVLVEPLVGLLIIGLSLFSMTISSELGKRRYKHYKWTLIGVKLFILPLAIGMYFWVGLFGVLLGYAIPYLIFGLLSMRHMHMSDLGINEAKKKTGFALRAFGVDITGRSIGLFDKILIGSIFGMVTLGLYQLSYQILAALGILPGILFTYLLPEKSAGMKTRGIEVFGLMASIVLACLVIFLSPIVIPRAFPRFSEGVRIIQIMSLAIIPSTIVATRMSGLYARERPGAVLISYAIALAVEIAGILVLGSYFGAIGLAASAVLLQTALAISLSLFRG